MQPHPYRVVLCCSFELARLHDAADKAEALVYRTCELAAPFCRNALKSLRGNPSLVGNVLRRGPSSLAPKGAGEDAPSSAPAKEQEPVLGGGRAAQGEPARTPEAGRSLPPWLAGEAHAAAEQARPLPGRADAAAAGGAVLQLDAVKAPAAGRGDSQAGGKGAALPGSRAAEGPRPSREAVPNGFRRGSKSPRSERSSSSISRSSTSTASSSRSSGSRSSADSSPSRHAGLPSVTCLCARLPCC